MHNFPMPPNPELMRHQQAQAARAELRETMEDVEQAVSALVNSSRRLEKLTAGLVALTVALIILTGVLVWTAIHASR